METSGIGVAQLFGSLAGIIAMTVTLIGIGKRFVGNWPVLMQVPTWVYACVIAEALTVAANRWLGVLPGQLGDLSLQALVLAAAASGFREWFDAGLATPISASTEARLHRNLKW